MSLVPVVVRFVFRALLFKRNSELECERFFLMGSIETKVLSYAGDIALFFADKKKSVVEALRLCTSSCAATGAAVSLGKCVGLWYKTWATTPPMYERIR